MWWDNEFVQNIIVAVISSFLTYVGWLKTKGQKQSDEFNAKVKELNDKVNSLEYKAVTEHRVRELIAEDTSDLRESTAALNRDIRQLTELIANLRVDLGILNYIKGANKNS